MYIFIVNPLAGSGRAIKTFSKIQSSQLYQKIESRYFLTKYSGHAEKIVRHLVKEQSNNNIIDIIVIGVDGTLYIVVYEIGILFVRLRILMGDNISTCVQFLFILTKLHYKEC